MPTPPRLTDDQRREAYDKSLAIRRKRAEIKGYITKGSMTVHSAMIHFPWLVGGMKVYSLLRALPGVGEATAARLLDDAGISRDLSVAQCGPRQTERLFALLDKR